MKDLEFEVSESKLVEGVQDLLGGITDWLPDEIYHEAVAAVDEAFVAAMKLTNGQKLVLMSLISQASF